MNIRNELNPQLLSYINEVLEVCSSRAVFVINHILDNGSMTATDLANEGYVHGARAVGDVRDNGVPLTTSMIRNAAGNRNIAEYTFGPVEDIKRHKFGGRVNFPKSLKRQLIERSGLVCAISDKPLDESELQIDHRIPFYVAGDIEGEQNPDDFMLLSRSMQRAKSWGCEQCPNLLGTGDLEVCRTCYWAYPEDYTHMATQETRVTTVTWNGDEVALFDALKSKCETDGTSIQSKIKELVEHDFA